VNNGELSDENLNAAAQIAEGEADDFQEVIDPYYEPYFCDEILRMADDMMFPEEWAAELGVSEPEMFNWIGKFPEFARAYTIAATKLRAAFTSEMRKVARGKMPFPQASLYSMFAKKRFPDLYGDPAPQNPPSRPAGETIPAQSHMNGATIEGTVITDEPKPAEDMEAPELIKELDALRRRHNME